jgi:hypothetical protein
MAPEVVIEFRDDPPQALYELADRRPDDIVLVAAKGFGATEFTVQAIVTLSLGTTAQIASVVREHIKAKKAVTIRRNGRDIEIEAPNVDDAIRLLHEIGGHPLPEAGTPEEGA